MKNIFRFLMAVAVLFTASCTKEDISSSIGGGEVEVTFSASLPELGTRAYADGANAGILYYKVFDNATNEALPLISGSVKGSKVFTVNIPMLKGMTYDIVFWAQKETDDYYTLIGKELTVKFDENKKNANDNDRDAFYAYVDGFNPATAKNEDTQISLYRPFGQLNAATSDFEAVKNNGVTLTTSSLKVTTFSKLNLETGVATEAKTVTFDATAIPTETLKAGYKYLSMNYLLPGTVDAVYTFKGKRSDNSVVEFTGTTYTNVPVKANYRTNILGKLLTASTEFTVTIENEFTADDKYGILDGKTYIRVENAEEFNAAFVDGLYDMIILEEDIVLDSSLTRAADPVLTVSKDKELTIDLNNFTLSSTSTQSGKSYNMFDVRGTLTVKNGTIEYQHTGDNMAWNNYAEIFYVGFDGTLNLDGVTAKNLGGSDMAYVVDMVNATNINVNINNSTLETPYIPIRVFNNSKSGVNNVTIKNSTLTGKYCFWVQYWLADGRDEATLSQTLKLDIYNSEEGESNSNTFNFNNQYDAPVLYGFNEAVYYDQYGKEIQLITPIEGSVGVGLDSEGNYVITADEGLASISKLIAEDENNFAGKTIVLDADVDLANVKTNGDSFAPIGSTGERDDRNRLICKPFKGTFDGNGNSIKNIYQSGWDMGYEWGQYGSIGLFAELEGATVKNVVIEGLEAQVEGGDISFIAGSATGDCVFENIEIKNSTIGTYNNGIGAIIGWSGAGNYTFKNIKIGSDVVIGGLWGSFDQSCGGIVGQAEQGASYHFEDVEISCRLDVYNDVIAAYKYYIYRMSGMIIGRCQATTTIDGVNYPDLSKYNITCKNVTVNYGDWMNYHYCVVEGKTAWRVEPGYAYGGIPADHDHSTCAMHCNLLIPFDALFGGDQYGVRPIKAYEGVTVNYPASYTPEE